MQVRKLTALNERVSQKVANMINVPAHVLPDVKLGEGRWFRLVPSLAGGNLDSGINMNLNIFEIRATGSRSHSSFKLTHPHSLLLLGDHLGSLLHVHGHPACKNVKLNMLNLSNLLLWAPGLSSCHGLLAILLSSISTSSHQALPPGSLVGSVSAILFSLLAQFTLG